LIGGQRSFIFVEPGGILVREQPLHRTITDSLIPNILALPERVRCF
jgi:hypothetical protein